MTELVEVWRVSDGYHDTNTTRLVVRALQRARRTVIVQSEWNADKKTSALVFLVRLPVPRSVQAAIKEVTR